MGQLEEALAGDDRGQGIALLFLDLDNFKAVNDSLGHEAGDLLLVEFGERLKRCLRPSDTAARLGGDEFTVLLEGVTSIEDATGVARRVEQELQRPFSLAGREVTVSTSIGIATATLGSDHAEELLRRADLAMYGAKNGGKSRYEVFEPSLPED